MVPHASRQGEEMTRAKVGVLWGCFPQQWHEPFLKRMSQVYDVDFRYARGEWASLDSLARDLTSREPDVFVTMDTPGTKAALAATDTVPIVSLVYGFEPPWPANL